MVSCIIRVKDAYVNSSNVSLQPTHIELFVKGELFSIVLADQRNEVIKEFQGPELAKLIGSGIANGKRVANTSHGAQYYYLGERS